MPKIKEADSDPNNDDDTLPFDLSASPARKSIRSSIKLPPCEIDISLASRKEAGSLTSTVPNKDKTNVDKVFKFKLTGEIPKLKEAKADVSMQKKGENGEIIASPSKKKLPPCSIDLSLAQRIKEGSMTSTITVDKSQKS